MAVSRKLIFILVWQTLLVWIGSWFFIIWPVVVGRYQSPAGPFLMGMLVVALAPSLIYLLFAAIFRLVTRKEVKWWGVILSSVVIWLTIIEAATYLGVI